MVLKKQWLFLIYLFLFLSISTAQAQRKEIKEKSLVTGKDVTITVDGDTRGIGKVDLKKKLEEGLNLNIKPFISSQKKQAIKEIANKNITRMKAK